MPPARFVFACASTAALTLFCSGETLAQMGPPQPPPPNPGLETGGLAPPPPVQNQPYNQPPQQKTATEQQLDTSVQEDSGRGLEWFWINVEGGYEFMGLGTLSSDGLTYGSTDTSGGGGMFGGGLGVRFLFLTFGARARLGIFSQWNLTTINGEAGFHIPIGELEPYATLGAGYAFLSGMDAKDWGADDVSINGFDVRAGVGLDYYVTPVFSVGANLTGEFLILSRSAVSAASLAQAATDPNTAQLDPAALAEAQTDGSGVGSALTLSAVLGLHF